MRYLRAQNLLPAELLEQIQRYVDGEYIYVPRQKNCKKNWGEQTDSKALNQLRNRKIFEDHQRGLSCRELSEKYYLAEKSLQKIIRNQRLEQEQAGP